MKKTYITPIIMIDETRMTGTILDSSRPHVDEYGNVVFPGGESEGGDADDGCAKEIIEMNENEKDPFESGLW